MWHLRMQYNFSYKYTLVLQRPYKETVGKLKKIMENKMTTVTKTEVPTS